MQSRTQVLLKLKLGYRGACMQRITGRETTGEEDTGESREEAWLFQRSCRDPRLQGARSPAFYKGGDCNATSFGEEVASGNVAHHIVIVQKKKNEWDEQITCCFGKRLKLGGGGTGTIDDRECERSEVHQSEGCSGASTNGAALASSAASLTWNGMERWGW